MTVIAYRDGVMASDSGVFSQGTIMPWGRKVCRGPDGVLYGGVGDVALCSEFLRRVAAGEDFLLPQDKGDGADFSVLIVRGDEVSWLLPGGEVRLFDAPYAAIGAAMDVAIGAMWAGASAEDAVRACLLHSQSAGGVVQVVRR